TLPQQAVSVGNHNFSATTLNPNGTIDNDTTNDSQTSIFSRIALTNALALPFTESFETGAFPPANWNLNNPDSYFTWERTALGAKSGNRSVRVNNFDYDAPGEHDELVLPAINLTSAVKPQLTFELAY